MRSYAEVLDRIQVLSPKERADVFKLQEHWQGSLPPVLRGENLVITQFVGKV
jgi:nitrogen-specific signal transduction histidine kinase